MNICLSFIVNRADMNIQFAVYQKLITLSSVNDVLNLGFASKIFIIT
jgi:hypothetical protein